MVLSSLSANRAEVLALFRDLPEGLTTKTCAEQTGKSLSRAGQVLGELSRLGLLTKETGQPGGGRPPNLYHLVPEFADFFLKPDKPLDHIEDLGVADFSYKRPPRGEGYSNKEAHTYEESYKKSPKAEHAASASGSNNQGGGRL